MKNYFKNRKPESINIQLSSLKKLMTFFKEECGVWSYLIYGTLLGSIREQNVISNDTDYDISILIPGNTFDEVKENFYKIGEILIKHNMLGKIWTIKKASGILNPKISDIKNPLGQMHIKTPDGKCYIDIWLSWVLNNKYYLTRGVQGTLNKNILVPFKYGKIQDLEFVIPNKSHVLLAYIYGEDWMIPQIKKSTYRKFTMKDML